MRRSEKRRRLFRSLLILLIIAVIGASLVSRYLCTLVTVHSGSMRPGLEQGTVVLSLTRKGDSIRRGDIVLFRYGQQMLFRRVIGLAGDTVTVGEDGQVLVNDAPLAEPYVRPGLSRNTQEWPLTVPSDTLFVLADTRGGTVDSRNADFGVVPITSVRGVAWLKVWPLYRIGFIEEGGP